MQPFHGQVNFLPFIRRIIAVVPIVGAGTDEDPHRPLFAPPPGTTVTGLISWSWEPPDDGKFAIVGFAAKEKAAPKTIAADSRVLKSCEKGKAKLEDVTSFASFGMGRRNPDLVARGGLHPYQERWACWVACKRELPAYYRMAV